MTTSASPFRRSASGSVVRRAGSQTTRAGQWNAPTTFFARGQVDRGLAADARVDLADERRRHRRPRHAAHVRRGGEAGDVGRGAAAERDERAVAADPQARPEPLEHRGRLGRLARRHLVPLDVARPERELRPDAVDPGDVRVGDERDRAVARDELAEHVERVELDVDARGGEHDAVHVERRGVGDVVVDGLPLAMEGVEGVGVARERPVGAARPAAHAVSGSTSSSTVKARAASVARVRSESTAPPPSATTTGSPSRSTSWTVASSSARKPASPSCSKSSAIVRARSATRSRGRGRRSAGRAVRRSRARGSSCPSP